MSKANREAARKLVMPVEWKKYLGQSGVFLLVLLCTCWFPTLAQAGWRILATTTFPGSPASAGILPQIATQVSHNKLKYETRSWAQVVDLESQQLLVINHTGQMYWEGSIDEYLTTMTSRLLEVRTQREKALQRLSPEQRLTLERYGGPFDTTASTLEVTVTPTAEKTTVAGHDTRKYIVLRNGDPYEETWVAAEINFAADVDVQKWKEFVRKLQTSRTTPPGTVLAELTELVDKGYPVKTVNLLSNLTKEVIQAQRKDIPAEEFMAPKDYAQKALTEVMAPPKATTKPGY